METSTFFQLLHHFDTFYGWRKCAISGNWRRPLGTKDNNKLSEQQSSMQHFILWQMITLEIYFRHRHRHRLTPQLVYMQIYDEIYEKNWLFENEINVYIYIYTYDKNYNANEMVNIPLFSGTKSMNDINWIT